MIDINSLSPSFQKKLLTAKEKMKSLKQNEEEKQKKFANDFKNRMESLIEKPAFIGTGDEAIEYLRKIARDVQNNK